jgi:integrase
MAKNEKGLKTQADVFKLPVPATGEKVYFDKGGDRLRAPGLGLRVRPGRARTWVVFYRWGGKLKRVSLGEATDNPSGMTLANARDVAAAWRRKVAEGNDPALERLQREDEARAEKTLGELADAYLAHCESWMKPRTIDGTRRHLTIHWKPLRPYPAHAVTADTVADRLQEIEKAHGPVARNRARSTLSAMFAWAVGERVCKLVKINPVVGTVTTKESAGRERVLSDAELGAIWNATADTDYGRIVRLLMLTACRRDEIGKLGRAEVVLDDSPRIALPGSRTKNRRAHDVPLAPTAVSVVKAALMAAGESFVFGRSDTGFSGWSASKGRLDAAAGIAEEWDLHDLRRTAATRMADLGVQPHVIEALLNHISGHKAGVAGIYNRSTYGAEKSAALVLWAAHILKCAALQAGGNVVNLKPQVA